MLNDIDKSENILIVYATFNNDNKKDIFNCFKRNINFLNKKVDFMYIFLDHNGTSLEIKKYDKSITDVCMNFKDCDWYGDKKQWAKLLKNYTLPLHIRISNIILNTRNKIKAIFIKYWIRFLCLSKFDSDERKKYRDLLREKYYNQD